MSDRPRLEVRDPEAGPEVAVLYDPTSPFGGYKASGFGREMGKEAIDILQVVGLVAKPSALAALEEFRMMADRRWGELVAALPPGAPGR